MVGGMPEEIIASGRAAADFLRRRRRDTRRFRSIARQRRREGSAAKSLYGARDGRVLQAWIGQSIVGSGPELRTRSVVRDLTPEREWETALRLSRERFQRFFANAPVGIALIDRIGRLEEANRALGELFGAAQQDLIVSR